MCEFCKSIKKENEDDMISLAKKEISFGMLGTGEIEIEIEIDIENGKSYIGGWINYDDGCVGVTKEINFCPICGRDLRKEQE